MSGAGPIAVLDSVTDTTAAMSGAVVVAGSHGAVYAAAFAAKHGARAVILNDAGGGRDGAGRSGLDWCAAIGMAAACVSHDSARIGDGADMMAGGIVSAANEPARALGCVPGMPCAEAAARLIAAAPPGGAPPPVAESRDLVETPHGPVVLVDSAALVRPEDAGRVVVTGSHGGVVRHRADRPLAVTAQLALFSDAGVGKDGAGLSRLPVLALQGVPAATASVESAGIGSARMIYDHGVLSHANSPAAALGIMAGMTVRDAVARALQHGTAASPRGH